MFPRCSVRRVALLSAVVALLAAPLPPASAGTAEPDVMFGHRNVDPGLDRDVITVGGDLGKFDRIRFRVLGHGVHVETLRVVYRDGSDETFPLNADIAADQRSGWIAVKGDRFIREIHLSYRPHPGLKGQARVEVTGQYTGGWLAQGGEGRRYHDGWVLLGAQTAGFTGYDRDVIRVGANEGGFARLRIEAVDRAITLREVRVTYAQGADEVFRMRVRVDPGTPYGPLVFKRGSAPIVAIEVRYRSRFDWRRRLKSALRGQPAVVQVWGQH